MDWMPKSRCAGCGTCYNICLASCIRMEQDSEGFNYPEVDSEKCISCGECRRVCPVIYSEDLCSDSAFAYCVIHKDWNVRKLSSSGGAFGLLAEQILNEDGVVFGAVYDESWNVKHISAETQDGTEAMQQSKYVQSNLENTFSECRNYLDKGRKVLFSGTSCQIAGLLSFTGNSYENLFTLDFICNSVPSPAAWVEYIKWLENMQGSKLTHVNQRTKTRPWSVSPVSYSFADGTKYVRYGTQDSWKRIFWADKGLIARPSCFECQFRGISRLSDITVGDFHGISDFYPDMFDDGGTSIVIIQNERGDRLFNAVKEKCVYKKFEFNDDAFMSVMRKHNRRLFESGVMHPNRVEFFNRLGKEPFDRLVEELL